MTLYKLTDATGWTRQGESNALLWGEGVTHEATGEGSELCSSGVIHVYRSPRMATFMNPVHANIASPVLWEVDGEIVVDDGLKGGVKKATTLRRIDLPIIGIDERVEIAIRCAKLVYHDHAWNSWADSWLAGEDRTRGAAWEAAAKAAAIIAAVLDAAAARAASDAATAWEAAARAASYATASDAATAWEAMTWAESGWEAEAWAASAVGAAAKAAEWAANPTTSHQIHAIIDGQAT